MIFEAFIEMHGVEVGRFMMGHFIDESKKATDDLWLQKNGVSAYSLIGKIIVGCGICWILISLIPIVCKTPLSECTWMIFLGAIQIAAGIVLMILSRKSEKFRKWANKDFRKGLDQKKNLEEKVKIGKRVLPMTYGDVLALKILGIIAILLIVILGIGTLQGSVTW